MLTDGADLLTLWGRGVEQLYIVGERCSLCLPLSTLSSICYLTRKSMTAGSVHLKKKKSLHLKVKPFYCWTA